LELWELFFSFLVSWCGVRLCPLGSSVTDCPIIPVSGVRCVWSILVEWELAGETEVLRVNSAQCHHVHHKSHMTWPVVEPRAAAVGRRKLTARAMAWSLLAILFHHLWRKGNGKSHQSKLRQT
jgi:hypothetical protein